MAQIIVDNDVSRIKTIIREVFGTDQIVHIERLGGLTNHSYKVQLPNQDTYVIRLPGDGTEELINRTDERISTELACELGIDTALLYFGQNGVKISKYINKAHTLSAEDMRIDDNLKKVARILRTLHTCGKDTKVPFEIFTMAQDYEQIIKNNAVPLFEDYEQTKRTVMEIKAAADRVSEGGNVPCHNDPLCENWVMDGSGRLYLIDWEYAGMNDGMWDLADVSIEAGLSAEHDAALLHHYFGRPPKINETMRFMANKVYLDFLWSLWRKARVPFDGDAMDEYGTQRYVRLQENIDAFAKTFMGKEVL